MQPVIGLDFGTTNSAIAVATSGKRRRLLPSPMVGRRSEPDKVAALIQIISENLGYALYRAVESTKVELTENEDADFVFGALLCEHQRHSRTLAFRIVDSRGHSKHSNLR